MCFVFPFTGNNVANVERIFSMYESFSKLEILKSFQRSSEMPRQTDQLLYFNSSMGKIDQRVSKKEILNIELCTHMRNCRTYSIKLYCRQILISLIRNKLFSKILMKLLPCYCALFVFIVTLFFDLYFYDIPIIG